MCSICTIIGSRGKQIKYIKELKDATRKSSTAVFFFHVHIVTVFLFFFYIYICNTLLGT